MQFSGYAEIKVRSQPGLQLVEKLATPLLFFVVVVVCLFVLFCFVYFVYFVVVFFIT